MSGPLYRHSPGVLERSIDGWVVVHNPATDEAHALDVIGSIVWRLLDTSSTFDEVVLRLAEQFDEAPDQIGTDVRPLFDQLSSAGLVERVTPTD